MDFQISGLPRETFEPLFGLDDAALRQHRACRVVADRPRAFPCRVSLVDAVVGEALILVHYEHLPADSPFRAGHAVYVRVDSEDCRLAIGEVPLLLRTRTLSVRAFDRHDLMQAAELDRRTRSRARHREAIGGSRRSLPSYSLCGAWLFCRARRSIVRIRATTPGGGASRAHKRKPRRSGAFHELAGNSARLVRTQITGS